MHNGQRSLEVSSQLNITNNMMPTKIQPLISIHGTSRFNTPYPKTPNAGINPRIIRNSAHEAKR